MTLKEYLSEKDRFASAAGVELLEIKEGYARARMLVQPKHLNGGGVCQGGAVFTLADLAFAAAATRESIQHSRKLRRFILLSYLTMHKSTNSHHIYLY